MPSPHFPSPPPPISTLRFPSILQQTGPNGVYKEKGITTGRVKSKSAIIDVLANCWQSSFQLKSSTFIKLRRHKKVILAP